MTALPSGILIGILKKNIFPSAKSDDPGIFYTDSDLKSR
jgi:hypothetical protein